MWERYCRGVSAILFVVDSAVPLPSDDDNNKQKSVEASSADADAQPKARNPWLIATEELHSLVTRPQLAGIPLLVLATKNDVKGAVSAEEVIRVMYVKQNYMRCRRPLLTTLFHLDRRLETISNREVSCYSISSKRQVNIDVTLRWLCARSPSSAR
jgi:ADP-ribosylation factor-like protein 8